MSTEGWDEVDKLSHKFSNVYLDRNTPIILDKSNKYDKTLRPLEVVPEEITGHPKRLKADDPFFRHIDEFATKWGLISEESKNNIKLACGYLDFPVILLQNPCDTHAQQYDQMFSPGSTLNWVRKMLGQMNLTMDDICIWDTLPMISTQWLDTRSLDEQKDAIEEAFALTIKFVETFQPRTLISCQCATGSAGHKFGTIDHSFARYISSSLRMAQDRLVSGIKISEHYILLVVLGFHPGRLIRERISQEDTTLRELFRTIYAPCSDWKGKHCAMVNAQKEVEAALRTMTATLEAYRNTIQPLRDCCQPSRSGRLLIMKVQNILNQLDIH
ncbi:hypothetical protein LOZ57_006151 [Ophidiomyces ophidiicola]|uniref:uncharacterized protein n=1 Tax=Ophidiomyces ophidiicola TaxID=1387563 RepID=UPI0020C1CD0F|nr:uncharacterized protein LOZ57_006151 [Ophidiomyces ophidiicola]KAI1939191.1 hypothetical protein LOZ57_006151 [Ophidiomyces ophidiicola]KAI2058071.1 hypothetical protein LOZ43_002721 [Ophidiomyces ophidiicola]KAI2079763.1 hypothetical protein LOZ36_006665 [Ophidiomyces ophidiicola]